jgi:hypothetical protein
VGYSLSSYPVSSPSKSTSSDMTPEERRLLQEVEAAEAEERRLTAKLKSLQLEKKILHEQRWGEIKKFIKKNFMFGFSITGLLITDGYLWMAAYAARVEALTKAPPYDSSVGWYAMIALHGLIFLMIFIHGMIERNL